MKKQIGDIKNQLKNVSNTKEYKKWQDMFRRCYNKNFLKNNPTYKGCSVCEEWHNFTNFYNWYQNNYYEIEGEKIDLDKDILSKQNKIYSPDTCIFVPHRINTIFVKNFDESISKCKNGKNEVYRISVKITRRTTKSKTCATYEEAKKYYQIYKKEKIVHIAESYYKKGLIPYDVYNVLINY